MTRLGKLALASTTLLAVAAGCGATADEGGARPGDDRGGAAGSAGGAGSSPPVSGGGGAAGSGKPSVPPPASSFTCQSGAKAAPPRLWRLTASELNNTVADLLGDNTHPASGEFFKGSGQGGFLNAASDLRVRDAEAVPLRLMAKTLAAQTVMDAKRLELVFATAGCTGAKTGDAACAQKFVTEFGKRAFRRPLDKDEADGYLALYNKGQSKGDKLGVRVVIEAMLQSPKFLYRFELGDEAKKDGTGRVRLTPYELASALSYHLTAAPPDAPLLQAADRNELGTPAQIEAQARRLLQSPRARDALAEFYRQMTELEELETRDKDTKLFPEYATVRGDMTEELRRYVGEVLFGQGSDATLKTLLTANFTMANGNIAKLYDPATKVTSTTWQKIMTKPEERAGLLTLPGLMASLAVLERTSPVNRGRFVQERFFCNHVPDPPGNVDTSVPNLAPGLTRRQQLDAKTSGAACTACHGMMNGIGFGLENLDAIGRYRTKEENGAAIDPTGEIKSTRDADGPFTGPRGLADKLVASQQVKECFAIQSFRYALGRAEDLAADGCSLKSIHDRFAASGYDLRELAIAVALSDAFTTRQR